MMGARTRDGETVGRDSAGLGKQLTGEGEADVNVDSNSDVSLEWLVYGYVTVQTQGPEEGEGI